MVAMVTMIIPPIDVHILPNFPCWFFFSSSLIFIIVVLYYLLLYILCFGTNYLKGTKKRNQNLVSFTIPRYVPKNDPYPRSLVLGVKLALALG